MENYSGDREDGITFLESSQPTRLHRFQESKTASRTPKAFRRK
jgi:hypothetical protein